MIARILIWDLFDSKTTIEELREQLPDLPEGDVWITNDAHGRFGLIAFGDVPPDLGPVPDLVGSAPQVAEEFDVVA